MTSAAEGFATVTDLLALPDDGRGVEIIDGATPEFVATASA